MKKKIIITAFALLLLAAGAEASLWTFYEGQLPSISYRAKFYANIAKDTYRGTAKQNIQLEDYLRNQNNTIGAVKPFRPSKYSTTLASSLAEGGSETTLKVNSITLPDGTNLSQDYYGDLLILTVGSGNSEEKIAVSNLATTTKTFTIVSRGLEYGRWASSTANIKQHLPGERVFVSNDDHWIYQQLPDIASDETITGLKTFSTFPKSSGLNPSDNYEFATKYYVDNVATSGAANMSETVNGLGEVATKAEAAAGSTTGETGAVLLLPASMATTTPTATTSIPITNASGKLSDSFTDFSLDKTWTGQNTFSATTTLGTTTFNVFPTTPNSYPTASTSVANKGYSDVKDTSYTFGRFSSTTPGTGPITVTHGLGATPRFLKITAHGEGSVTGLLIGINSTGVATSTAAQSVVYFTSNDSNISASSADGYIFYLSGGTNRIVRGSLTTLNSTQFIITIDTFGSSAKVYALWEAYE